MLIVTFKRPCFFFTIALFITLTVVTLFQHSSYTIPRRPGLLGSVFNGKHGDRASHFEVFSASTTTGRYFVMDFGSKEALNPNIIPHPIQPDTWILVAQLQQDSRSFAELTCNAAFENDTMKCKQEPSTLPIAPTFGDKCTGDLEVLALNEGPHDARVFYGPHAPYTLFGSNSRFACFGLFMQDLRGLVEWGYDTADVNDFAQVTELQRPPPWGAMEKNWFVFYDEHDEAYLHYDVHPKRSYAKLEQNGEVGADLASLTEVHDEQCMAKYMPKIGPTLESIHQATNSLLLTLCKRNDAPCTPDLTNTFLFTIFQHKTYFNYHALYEPYIMLFEQNAPFQIHAMSQKPFWIHGRKGWDRIALAEQIGQDVTGELPESQQQEMFYITSMSWKDRRQKYHGYIDDVLFVSFGIEDRASGGIDVVVGDLLQDLGFC